MNLKTNRSTLEIGITGGLIAAVTVELFLFAAGSASWPGTYQWIASAAVGKAAYGALAFAWLGVAMHLAVSVTWGVLYAVTAERLRALREHPLAAGIAYGLLVFVVMQAITIVAGTWAPPAPQQLAVFVLDHTVFFGLPLAWYVARRLAPERRIVAAAHG